ncbi:hypothetical protein [Streptomyces sp. PTD5-9]|uniref:hypothetical protein n=1 Tax=Streptomyces sp. PTD5-9 TaxID=3120150 RepID=UPI0030080759
MAVARRPLLTAAAAGTLLAALWFVPSADAMDERADAADAVMATAAGAPGRGLDAQAVLGGEEAAVAADEPSGPGLAETGAGTGFDTSPYLAGCAAFLGVGAAFVTCSIRRTGALST